MFDLIFGLHHEIADGVDKYSMLDTSDSFYVGLLKISIRIRLNEPAKHIFTFSSVIQFQFEFGIYNKIKILFFICCQFWDYNGIIVSILSVQFSVSRK